MKVGWYAFGRGVDMVTIGSQTTLLRTLHDFNRTQGALKSIYQKLATGKQILSGQDSPTLLQRLANLTSTVNGIEVASQNASVARGYMGVADGGLVSINDTLQQLRGLAVEASSDLLSPAERSAITLQSQNLLDALNQTANSSTYNGTKLLDGSFGTKTIQVGPNEGDTVSISLADARAATLGVDGIDLTTSASAGTAITALDDAISQVNASRASVGTSLQRLDNTIIANGYISTNYTAARSLLEDLDYARGTAELMKLQILSRSSIYVLQAGLQSERSKLSIFA